MARRSKYCSDSYKILIYINISSSIKKHVTNPFPIPSIAANGGREWDRMGGTVFPKILPLMTMHAPVITFISIVLLVIKEIDIQNIRKCKFKLLNGNCRFCYYTDKGYFYTGHKSWNKIPQ